eukprot:gnl/MRDRNA2_/MRDRNA2_27248_c0_seq1.p1 gnl/MRDRNA2_/MRDRNA2_27248_c0~~gnl/MRDRNA2_/MRDRNA2_27248_c0_seq1.p1  ORF type:complete len:391 (+),score=45.75 gnl/MRDRNA2_/MRDRNA2_27248_c0_seq1:67-1173(+)
MARAKRYEYLSNELSPTLRGEVAVHIVRRYIRQVSWISDAETGFIFKLATCFALHLYSPGEFAIPDGYQSAQCFRPLSIMERGFASRLMCATLTAGCVWHDDMILWRVSLMDPTLGIALVYCSVYCLPREVLFQVLEEDVYPEAKMKVRRAAAHLMLVRSLKKAAAAHLAQPIPSLAHVAAEFKIHALKRNQRSTSQVLDTGPEKLSLDTGDNAASQNVNDDRETTLDAAAPNTSGDFIDALCRARSEPRDGRNRQRASSGERRSIRPNTLNPAGSKQNAQSRSDPCSDHTAPEPVLDARTVKPGEERLSEIVQQAVRWEAVSSGQPNASSMRPGDLSERLRRLEARFDEAAQGRRGALDQIRHALSS